MAYGSIGWGRSLPVRGVTGRRRAIAWLLLVSLGLTGWFQPAVPPAVRWPSGAAASAPAGPAGGGSASSGPGQAAAPTPTLAGTAAANPPSGPAGVPAAQVASLPRRPLPGISIAPRSEASLAQHQAQGTLSAALASDQQARQRHAVPPAHAVAAVPAAPAGLALLPATPDAAPPLIGTQKSLAIVVQFAGTSATVPSGYLWRSLYHAGGYNEYGPGNPSRISLRDYYAEVSYNQFTLTGEVVGNNGAITNSGATDVAWITLPQTMAYYANSQEGMGTMPQNSQQLAQDAFNHLIAHGFNFAPYANASGELDSVFIVHAGYAAEESSNTSYIRSLSWWLPTPLNGSGGSLSKFVMVPELSYPSSTRQHGIGVAAHEGMHQMGGLPDLYQKTTSNGGAGFWELMANGHFNNGDTQPAHLSAWSRIKVGWVAPTVVTSFSNYTLPAVESSPTIYKLPISGTTTEYFLLENRQPVGTDAALPGSGLLIWHIDEQVINNPPGGGVNNGVDRTCASHFGVALLQADGAYDLELHGGEGDNGDPFPGIVGATQWTPTANPSSATWCAGASSWYATGITTVGQSVRVDLSKLDPNLAPPTPTAGVPITWGYNDYGQLGDGTLTTRRWPRQVKDDRSAVAMAAGSRHGLLLTPGGSVYSWGDNTYGQLGIGSYGGGSLVPTAVINLTDVVAIAAGQYHSVALKRDGTVWAWGKNDVGQLGLNGGSANAPIPVSGLTGITAIASGNNHVLALKNNLTLYAWGFNGFGQLGDGTQTNRMAPITVSGSYRAIAAGTQHSVAATADGFVRAWGQNDRGQLGDGSQTTRLTPVAVATTVRGITAVAAGESFSLARTSRGAVWLWGDNTYGQLALGSTSPALRPTPASLAGLSDVTAIATGAAAAYVIRADQSLWAWGQADVGQLGEGGSTARSTPVQTGAGMLAVAGGQTMGAGVKTITNDDFSSVTVIPALPYNTTQDVRFATSAGYDPADSCTNGTSNHSVWYRYTSPAVQTISVDRSVNGYSSKVGIWTGSLDHLTLVTCPSSSVSSFTFNAAAGQTYYLGSFQSDDSPSATGGTLIFSLSGTVPTATATATATTTRTPTATATTAVTAPANDSANTPYVISPASLPTGVGQDTTLATHAPDDPPFNVFGNVYAYDHSVWYQFTPQHNGTYSVDPGNSNYTVVAVAYRGTVPASMAQEAFGLRADSVVNRGNFTFTGVASTTYSLMFGSLLSNPPGFLSFNLSEVQATATATATRTPTTTATGTRTPTTTSTATSTATNTPTLTSTATRTPNVTGTVAATITVGPTLTPTGTPGGVATATAAASGVATATTAATGAGLTPTATATTVPVVTVVQPASGGSATLPTGSGGQGSTTVAFPPGAVSTPVTVTITQTSPTNGGLGSLKAAGAAFTIEARDAAGNPVTRFDQRLTITVVYTPADVAGIDESTLRIYYYDTNLLAYVTIPTEVLPATHTLVGTVDHLTQFAALGQPAAAASSLGNLAFVTPVRVVDTRSGLGFGPGGAPIVQRRFAAGETRRFKLGGQSFGPAGALTAIPAGITGVMVNVTIVQDGPSGGFVTVFPGDVADAERPNASTVNPASPTGIAANFWSVGVPVAGAYAGTIAVYSTNALDVIVDLVGYYHPANPATVGNLAFVNPVRVLDTRARCADAANATCHLATVGYAAAGADAVAGPFTPDSTRRFGLGGRSFGSAAQGNAITFPASVSGLLAHVTTAQGSGSGGYVTLLPGDVTGKPGTSTVNPGTAIAFNSWANGLPADGTFAVYSTEALDVIVDVVGYFSPQNLAGQPGVVTDLTFVTPTRVLDTRGPDVQGPIGYDPAGAPIPAGGFTPPAGGGQTRRYQLGGVGYPMGPAPRLTLPADMRGIIANVTIVQAGASGGFVTVYPGDAGTLPGVSTVNPSTAVAASLWATGLPSSGLNAGELNVYSTNPLDVIIDVVGYYR